MFESSVKKRYRYIIIVYYHYYFLTFLFDIRINNCNVSVAHWFVGKLLFFFEYNLQLNSSDECGSLYAIVEVMKTHKTSPYSKSIPMVQPFVAGQVKKYAVIDVADIKSVVGLIQKTEIRNRQVDSTNWFYVISPSTAFNVDMASCAGKLSELLKRKRKIIKKNYFVGDVYFIPAAW